MNQVLPYITFNGNCRQAMTFYQQVLGGKLFFQTVGETPLAKNFPTGMLPLILHATLTNSHFILMGSDMVFDKGLVKGNSVSLMLNCYSKEEIEILFEQLSTGGITDHALEETFWGARLGNLTDQYGNHWILHLTKKTKL